MRAALTIMIVLGISAGPTAQTIGLPLPSIGLPLPSIGLPLPPIGLPPLHRATEPPARQAPPSVNVPRPANARGIRGGARTFVYFIPTYEWNGLGAPIPGPPPPVAPPAPPPRGHLTIDVHDDVDPQVFIDDAYIGTLADLGGELTLAPGVHRLELLAEDYEPLIVDVQILADRTTRYRASLSGGLSGGSASPDSALTGIRPTSPPVPPATIYMIPGCYVGNLPPQQVTLPAGCDPNRAMAFPSSK